MELARLARAKKEERYEPEFLAEAAGFYDLVGEFLISNQLRNEAIESYKKCGKFDKAAEMCKLKGE